MNLTKAKYRYIKMATAAVSSVTATHDLPTYHQVPETKFDRMWCPPSPDSPMTDEA